MNTKKIIMPLLLLAVVAAAVLSLSGCGACGTPKNPEYETKVAPNGENFQVQKYSCFAPIGFRDYETVQYIFVMQGDVTASNTTLDLQTAYNDTISFSPLAASSAANNGFTARAQDASLFNKTEPIGILYDFSKSTSAEDIATAEIQYIPDFSAATNTPAIDVVEQYYGTKKTIRVSVDFTGKLFLFAAEIYTVGLKKPATKTTLGAASTVLYDETTRFISTYGAVLAKQLTDNGVQFLDTKKTALPVGGANMFFEDGTVAKESVWSYDYLNPNMFEFYESFKEDADPAAIRALMQAAEAVNDPRLLVIERATTSDNLKITAFGAVAFDAAMPANGYEFTWDFTGSNLQKIITDDLLRAIQVEYTEESLR